MGKGSGWIWAHIRSGLRPRPTPVTRAAGSLRFFFLAGRRRDPRPLDPLGAALDGNGEAAVELEELECGAGCALLLARHVTRGYRSSGLKPECRCGAGLALGSEAGDPGGDDRPLLLLVRGEGKEDFRNVLAGSRRPEKSVARRLLAGNRRMLWGALALLTDSFVLSGAGLWTRCGGGGSSVSHGGSCL